VDHAAFDHVSRPLSIGLHVRGGCVRFERFRARLFLDYDSGVRPKFGLGRPECRKIDNRNVLDATLFGMHGRHVGSELSEHGFAHTGLCSDIGQNVQHECSPDR
jgi:hypothetical protein